MSENDSVFTFLVRHLD